MSRKDKFIMNILKTILKLMVLLLGSIFLGAALLWLVFLLPVAPMAQHARDAVKVFSIERNYPVMDGTEATKLDNWTDSLMLDNAVFLKEGTRPLELALEVYNPEYESGNPTEAFILYMNKKEPLHISSYSRYWHGYLVVLKPLLMFTGYQGIRGLNRILQPLLVLAAAVFLWRRQGFRPVVPLAAAWLFLRPAALAFSMQFSTVFYTSMVGVLVLALGYDWLSQENRMLYFFLLTGIVTNYVDFLTYPVASLGIPMVIWLCLAQNRSFREYLQMVVFGSVCWGLGYAGMWAGKWILGSALLGHNILADALNQARFRSSSDAGIGIAVSRGIVILRNLYTGAGKWGLGLWLALAAWVLAVVAVRIWRSRENRWNPVFRAIPFLLTAVMPLVWYGVLLNHSFVHHWFTYRALAVSVMAAMGIGIVAGTSGDNPGTASKSKTRT